MIGQYLDGDGDGDNDDDIAKDDGYDQQSESEQVSDDDVSLYVVIYFVN